MSKNKELPANWKAGAQAAKATQVAFDMDEQLQYCIRRHALENRLSPSEQIRQILSLSLPQKTKRPRLTVSLSAEDYTLLAKRFSLNEADQLEIKKKVQTLLIEFVNTHGFDDKE